MAYNETYRSRAVAFKDSGHTFKELKQVFGVGNCTYKSWKVLKETTGFYAPKSQQKATRKRKIDPEKLKLAVQEKPDIYLRELAVIFDCSIPSVHKRLQQLKITLKKKPSPTPKSPNKPERDTSKK